MAALAEHVARTAAAPATRHADVAVIGAGPVGIAFARRLAKRAPSLAISLFSGESVLPYDRVRLSGYLAGAVTLGDLTDGTLPDNVTLLPGRWVTEIDRRLHSVTDAGGAHWTYNMLVLATGSRPYVPAIPGRELSGVFTFRDLADAERLAARRTRARRVVVVGAGLLGIETARAMQRLHTEVCLVEHSPWPMMAQLDEDSGARLAAYLRSLGMDLRLSEAVEEIGGRGRVEWVRLRDGRVVETDTVVFSTGIRPNVDLAHNAGLSVGRGVRVDDRMCTSDPHIWAIGECAEHDGKIYGLVAPGLDQAAVAAETVLRGEARYRGSVPGTQLKVVGESVLSAGRVAADAAIGLARDVVWKNDQSYRRLVIHRDRLVGVIAYGPWEQGARIHAAVLRNRRVWPWQLWRFRRTGDLYASAQSAAVARWPAASVVCNCRNICRGELSAAMRAGYTTVDGLRKATGASNVCGSCRPLLAELVGQGQLAPAERHAAQGALALTALILLALAVFLPALPFAQSAQHAVPWDEIWRDGLWRQLSGYTLLALGVGLSAIVVRKRVRRLSLGAFAGWRVWHAVLGLCVLAVFAAHTGFRFGENLNRWLATAFALALFAGAVAALVIATEHRLPRGQATTLRRSAVWLHLLVLWPVPVLLAAHIVKAYYF